jgi:hypothetical protein
MIYWNRLFCLCLLFFINWNFNLFRNLRTLFCFYLWDFLFLLLFYRFSIWFDWLFLFGYFFLCFLWLSFFRLLNFLFLKFRNRLILFNFRWLRWVLCMSFLNCLSWFLRCSIDVKFILNPIEYFQKNSNDNKKISCYDEKINHRYVRCKIY